MKKTENYTNPFNVTTPEGLSAEDASKLFVDVLSDFPDVDRLGHVFINGPRGAGKSMILRYLMADCQCIKKECRVEELGFFSVYLSIKNTDLRLTELSRLEGQYAENLLNEHLLVLAILQATLQTVIANLPKSDNQEVCDAVKSLINDTAFPQLKNVGWVPQNEVNNNGTESVQVLEGFLGLIKQLYNDVIRYLKKQAFSSAVLPWEGPLCDFFDFLLPTLQHIRKLPFTPEGPIFLLIDDADNLNLSQTKCLNSWVSARITEDVSLKISTQQSYKTFYTAKGERIESPHDFSDVNISTIYTTSGKATYKDRVKEIVQKRLILAKISDIEPVDFFPVNAKQEAAIQEIAQLHRDNWETKGRGHRASDDATRYARPDYIKSLGGSSKSTSTYSYAGFDQLVHVSSGVVRFFLEAASSMYTRELANKTPQEIKFIEPSNQDRAVREQAAVFFDKEFERLMRDQSPDAPPNSQLVKLSNLIQALGGVFNAILLSDRSERRVFSIALSNRPDKTVAEVLSLGVQLGYLHMSTIGNKEGTGRTSLFILSRLLAPIYNLDPTSFAGYLFVTNDRLREALDRPESLLRRVKKEGVPAFSDTEEQLSIFNFEDKD